MKCKECKAKYDGAVCGQGFTKFICKKCGQIAWWYNTLVPNYCTACCEENYICEYCGKNLLIEAILEHKEKYNLYDVAIEAGVAESSLRKYIDTGSIGDRVLNKIIKWYKENYERRV